MTLRGRLRSLDAAVLSLVGCALAYSTMQMMIVPALPAIQHDLDAEPDEIAWIVSAFLASTAVASPLAGRCGDLFGKRRVLIVVLAIFSLGGVVGAFASSVEVLVVGRALQGVGGAVFPLAYALSRDIVSPARVAVTIGLISGSFGIGGTAGLVLSGVLVDHVAWQATVAVGAVLGVLASWGVLRSVPPVPMRGREPLDPVGGLLVALGLVLLLFGISGHLGDSGASGRAALLACGTVVLMVWARWEARHRSPLVDVRLLRRPSVWPINAAGAAIGFGMYAFGFLLPQLLQADPAVAGVGFGASVTTTSLYLLPALVSGLGAGAVAGLVGRRSGSMLPFVLGMAAMASGYVLLVVAMDASAVVVLATLVAHGVGLNLALAAMANLIVDGAPSERTAEASGVNATIRTIGGALGIPLVAIVLLAPRGGDELSGRGFELAFGLSALILLVGIALQPGLGRAVRRREVDSITAN